MTGDGFPGGEGEQVACGLERAIEGNDRVSKRRLLSRLPAFLSSTDNAAPAFISAGGIPLLLSACRDADDATRIAALRSLAWLAGAGYAREVREAGAGSVLPPLLSDPSPVVRRLAGLLAGLLAGK
ncbi:MAG: hypothetical protein QFX32_04860 [Methanolinea sp.]|nr:hypothetical protein [Methanolinea sp.]